VLLHNADRTPDELSMLMDGHVVVMLEPAARARLGPSMASMIDLMMDDVMSSERRQLGLWVRDACNDDLRK
jgi:hypothetical protein